MRGGRGSRGSRAISTASPGTGDAGAAASDPRCRTGPTGPAASGLTLLEVLVAIALLALIASFLLQMRLDAIRHAAAQRRHTQLTQLLRSEAEALRAGAATPGACSTLGGDLEQEGFTCDVHAACSFPPAACAAGAGLAAYVIRAAAPGSPPVEVPLLVRGRPTQWIVAQR